jgi:surface protein
MSNMLNSTAISETNFNSILTGWASQTVQLNVPLGAAGLKYSGAGYQGYNTLTTSPNSWSITGATYDSLKLVFNIPAENLSLTLVLGGLAIDNGTYIVNWGDGNSDTSTSHTYASAGLNTVSVIATTTDAITDFNATNQQSALVACNSFGNIGLINLTNAFAITSSNLITMTTTLPSTVTNITQMFSFSSFNLDISGWDTSNVTNMSGIFDNATSFNQDISGWNTDSVTNMFEMFNSATLFNQNIGTWNISNVTNMSNMLNGTAISVSNFNSILTGWASQTVQPNVPLGAVGLTYSGAGYQGYNTLTTSPNLWTITGATYDSLKLGFNFPDPNTTLTLTLGGPAIDNVTYIVDWGDGTINNSLSNTYVGSGPYFVSVSITSTDAITSFNGTDQQSALVACNSFGNIGLTSLSNAFASTSSNLITMTTTLPSTVTNISGMFKFSPFNLNISGWDTTNVVNMNKMFQQATSFNQDISSWVTSSVTNMGEMFNTASAFNQDISGWQTSLVTDMTFMFQNAASFNANISGWTTSGVTNMFYMFNNATSFNQDISGWTTSSVTNMSEMFNGATLFNQNIGNWNISNVTDMSNMLNSTAISVSNFNSILTGWASQTVQPNVPLGAVGLTYSGAGYQGYNTLTTSPNLWTITGATYDSLKLGFNFPDPNTTLTLTLDGPAIDNVTYIVDWGDGTINNSLSNTYASAGTYPVSVSITSTDAITDFNGTNQQARMTACNSFGNIGLTTLFNAFNNANNLNIITDTLPSTVTSLEDLFAVSTSLYAFSTTLIGSWDTTNVTNMKRMFFQCYSFNPNISSWDTTNVTNMEGMFFQAYNFNQDISGWVTDNVENMFQMFQNAASFNANISGWNTTKVPSMGYMFFQCYAFNQDISGWDTSSVTDMKYMFFQCYAFNQDISGWVTSSVTDMQNMFFQATMFNQDISTWNISNVTDMRNMLDSTAISETNFDNILNGWASRSVQPNVPLGAGNLTYTYTGLPGYNTLTNTPNLWTINGATLTCFKEGTLILTDKGYIPIENLKMGDLVLTYKHEYKKVVNIGTAKTSNFHFQKRTVNNLFIYTKEKFPELIEDLIITGGHSILVDEYKNEEEKNKNLELFNHIDFKIDDKFKLLSFIDENASIYEEQGVFNIYHLSLENEDEYGSYGIYANGWLVESCSNYYLEKRSNMKLLGNSI